MAHNKSLQQTPKALVRDWRSARKFGCRGLDAAGLLNSMLDAFRWQHITFPALLTLDETCPDWGCHILPCIGANAIEQHRIFGLQNVKVVLQARYMPQKKERHNEAQGGKHFGRVSDIDRLLFNTIRPPAIYLFTQYCVYHYTTNAQQPEGQFHDIRLSNLFHKAWHVQCRGSRYSPAFEELGS